MTGITDNTNKPAIEQLNTFRCCLDFSLFLSVEPKNNQTPTQGNETTKNVKAMIIFWV